jgi:hypothetical protein
MILEQYYLSCLAQASYPVLRQMTKPSITPSERVSGVDRAALRHLDAFIDCVARPAASLLEDDDRHWFNFVVETWRSEYDWQSVVRERLSEFGWSAADLNDLIDECEQGHALLRHLSRRGLLRT